VQGVSIQFHRYLFVVLLSLTVAVAIKAVGILLVNAFLVIPASTAKLFSQQFKPYLSWSVGIGALSSIVGMVVSGAFNLPSGPSIVLFQFCLFLMVFGLTKLIQLPFLKLTSQPARLKQ
jgi:zinc/manganese transport system permease protein